MHRELNNEHVWNSDTRNDADRLHGFHNLDPAYTVTSWISDWTGIGIVNFFFIKYFKLCTYFWWVGTRRKVQNPSTNKFLIKTTSWVFVLDLTPGEPSMIDWINSRIVFGCECLVFKFWTQKYPVFTSTSEYWTILSRIQM